MTGRSLSPSVDRPLESGWAISLLIRVQSWWTLECSTPQSLQHFLGKVRSIAIFVAFTWSKADIAPQIFILQVYILPYLLIRNSGLCVWMCMCIHAWRHVSAHMYICHWHFQVENFSVSQASVYRRYKYKIPRSSPPCLLFLKIIFIF